MTQPASKSPHISVAAYLFVFVALMGLLVLTVALATLPYRQWGIPKLGMAVALTIALVKAALVVAYFMHVKGSNRLVRVCAVTGAAWLLIMFVLTLADYLTRDWLPISGGW